MSNNMTEEYKNMLLENLVTYLTNNNEEAKEILLNYLKNNNATINNFTFNLWLEATRQADERNSIK